MIEVPQAFAASTISREGPAGASWIESLPGLVEDLCGDWGLVAEGPPVHGSVAVVVPVRRGSEPLVLKVSWIDQTSVQESLVLRAWNGRGAVRLVDARDEVGAMLLERLNAERTLEDVPPDEAARIAGESLRRLAIPPPPGLRTVGTEAETIAAYLRPTWEKVGRPFDSGLLDRALDVLASRGAESHGTVIVNQDLHYGNVLEGTREPWLVIDPKPLAGDPEFGVAQLLWSRFDELTGRAAFERRLEIVVGSGGLRRDVALDWSLVRVVEAWLWSVEQGMLDDTARYRQLVDWLPEP